ncbi:MAG TPA: hypothetical protein VFX59_13685 [Polyangiales bacterium]|nr:hypothetical protein [Polyangiales bacterium]
MLTARSRSDHWRLAAGALAVVCCLASRAEAQSEWQAHARAWFAADLAIAPVGRYTRELDDPGARDRLTRGGNLAASFSWVGEGPLGIGAHAAPGIHYVALPGANGRVYLIDVGVHPIGRLAWKTFELTLRVPFGLTTGRLNWIRTAEQKVAFASSSNDLGVGMHVGPVAGAVIWLGEWLGMRVESGLMYRRMKFDEGKTQGFPGDIEEATIRGEVTHHSLAWTISIGFVRRFNPASLPDENGPPLPTPDYYQPYPLTQSHSALRM